MADLLYDWNNPEDKDLLVLAQIITKYLHFFDPAVVSAIVQDNQKHAPHWRACLEARGIDSRLYLWDGSSCCFPGIRRYQGGQEKIFCKNKMDSLIQAFPDALELDFNEYPKKLCTYILGDSLAGIVHNYSLMHIINHNEITNQVWVEFPETSYLQEKGMYGLFTSPANTIYVPNSMINTISTNRKLKSLLAERQLQLYQQVCNIVPPGIQLRTKREERGNAWHIDRFTWAPCFGADMPMQDFLACRKDKVEHLLSITTKA